MPVPCEEVPDFADLGVRAFTTTRAAGSFAWQSAEPAAAILARWDGLRAELRAAGVERLATAHQVHGTRVLEHVAGWDGLLRANDADGHFSPKRGTAMAVTIADCVPVFIAHASGAAALLHSGWRGTAARIVDQGIAAFRRAGLAPRDLSHPPRPRDLRQVLRGEPGCVRRAHGASRRRSRRRWISAGSSPSTREMPACSASRRAPRCTKCDNGMFFSHRAGDDGPPTRRDRRRLTARRV